MIEIEPALAAKYAGVKMAVPPRIPVPGEVWTIHGPRDRTSRELGLVDKYTVYRNFGTRRVVSVEEGLVTYWQQTDHQASESLPGVASVWEFCERCRPLVRCPVCDEPAETDSDPCQECWRKADEGELL